MPGFRPTMSRASSTGGGGAPSGPAGNVLGGTYPNPSFASGVTNIELGYLSGVTSGVQAQLNAKAADSNVVKLTGTQTVAGAKTFSSAVRTNSGTGTASVYQIGSATCGIFGGSSSNRIGLKAGNLVVFDADANNSYIKIQNFPLKAEAGFSAGLYDLTANASTNIYLSNGATQLVTDTTSAVALTMDDDCTDPVTVAALAGGETTIKDASANGAGPGAGTNNIVITVQAAVGPIDGGTTATIDTNNGFVELTMADGFWIVTGGVGYTIS